MNQHVPYITIYLVYLIVIQLKRAACKQWPLSLFSRLVLPEQSDFQTALPP